VLIKLRKHNNNKNGVKKKMRLITVHVPEAYLSGIEELVNMQIYPNRSEVIRVALRDLLKSELKTIIPRSHD